MFKHMESIISQLNARKELSKSQVREVTALLLDEGVADGDKADILRKLSEKGETPGELAAFVEAFLEYARDPEMDEMSLSGPTIDVCGTGGDKLNLFNVSTTSMFVIAAGGAVVVKHGNRGITSKSGGADVLEALGIDIQCSSEIFRKSISEAGVGFLFAPEYHPAFKAVVGVRKLLAAEGVRTIFNLIGPLLNPVRPDYQLVGVFAQQWVSVFADILHRLGRKQAWAVHGQTQDGQAVDEMSIMGTTHICQSRGAGFVEERKVSPMDFGIELAEVGSLVGGEADENAAILKSILNGSDQGPKRDMVVLNSAAGLCCAGLAESIEEGVGKAKDLINSGEAMKRLEMLQKIAPKISH